MLFVAVRYLGCSDRSHERNLIDCVELKDGTVLKHSIVVSEGQ